MYKIDINAQTEVAKEAFITFIENYKETFAQQLNTFIQGTGGQSDAQISIDATGQLTIFQYAPDKGYVLGETTGELPITLQKYADLGIGQKYIIPESDRLMLYIKQDSNQPDIKLGAFKSLNDAIKEFNSEAVQQAVKNYNDRKKAEEKDLKRKTKLGKVKELPVEQPVGE